jgi:hypothetical protein
MSGEIDILPIAEFISGMDLGLLTGAVVAAAGCLVALICLPARSGRKDRLSERTVVSLSGLIPASPAAATPGPRARPAPARRPGNRTLRRAPREAPAIALQPAFEAREAWSPDTHLPARCW